MQSGLESESSELKPEASFTLYSDRVVAGNAVIPATIFVEDGIIQAVRNGSHRSSLPHQNHSGLVVAPGIVDAHVHINDPGRTSWEGFESATKAAAAGGVTTLIDMPLNSDPVTTSVETLRIKQNAAIGNDDASNIMVDVGFHGGLVPDCQQNIEAMVKAGVLGVKAFMCDSGLHDFPAASESVLRSGLESLRWTGVPLLVHAEITDDDSTLQPADPTSYQQYMRSRPPRFELRAIELIIRLCRETQSPVHIVHLATAEALPMIEAALDEGLPLTIETCPHYLYFADDMISDGDTRFKCAPPIRDADNRRRLRQAVADNIISTIGSDHSPCVPELKCLKEGNLVQAWGGISSLQLTLHVMLKIAHQESWSLPLLFDRLSRQPAQRFMLGDRKGQIAAGFDADFVIFDPDAEMSVCAEDLFHRHPITPYDRQLLRGKVEHTFVRGRQVFGRTSTDEPKSPVSSVGKILDGENRNSKHLASLEDADRRASLTKCCAATAWVERMMNGSGHQSDRSLYTIAREAWSELEETDYLEAFAAHPQIGDVETLAAKYRDTLSTASNEQQLVASADDSTIVSLARDNQAYLNKFGFIFIVFATGKTAAQMLTPLQRRLPNDRETEIRNAAAEQLKITLLRLSQLQPRYKIATEPS